MGISYNSHFTNYIPTATNYIPTANGGIIMIISCTSDKDVIALALSGAVAESDRLAPDTRPDHQVRRRALNNQIIPALIMELTRDTAPEEYHLGEYTAAHEMELASASEPEPEQLPRRRWCVPVWYPGDMIIKRYVTARTAEEAKHSVEASEQQNGGIPITANLDGVGI